MKNGVDGLIKWYKILIVLCFLTAALTFFPWIKTFGSSDPMFYAINMSYTRTSLAATFILIVITVSVKKILKLFDDSNL